MATVLEKEYATLAQNTTEALIGLKGAIKDMNDQSILHTQILREQTQAIANIEKFWGRIVMILIVAMIFLAGVEKIIKVIGL